MVKIDRIYILIIGCILFLLPYLIKFISIEVFLTSLISLLAFFIFDIIFKVNFKLKHYIMMFLIIFFGVTISPFYWRSGVYDKYLHLISPFLLALLFFYIFDRFKIKFFYKILLTFSSVLLSLIIFELLEYISDFLWNTHLQGVFSSSNIMIQSKLEDTFYDLTFGIFGTIFFCLFKITEYLDKSKSFRK